MIVTPQKATTVILLREETSKGFEVFLVRRHDDNAFMGGNYVYPGGRVDPTDQSPDVLSFCQGLSPERACEILGHLPSSEESMSYWIAGIRELFEEAGILLAYGAPRASPCLPQAGVLPHSTAPMGRHPGQNMAHSSSRLASREVSCCRDDSGEKILSWVNRIGEEKLLHYRESLHRKDLRLSHLAQQEKIFLALDQLHYYAHWITPEARPIRFDTRFFVALHPSGQEASHDQRETTHGLWITPCQALEENLNGEVILSPPTLKTLEDLSRFSSIDDVLRSLQGRNTSPILPVFVKLPSEILNVFPWDPEYNILRKGEMPPSIEHGRLSEPGDNTTRVVLREGRWYPYCRT
jgi:8-oxo-dGTP pyrophosphatase MutT (NUDIX family)